MSELLDGNNACVGVKSLDASDDVVDTLLCLRLGLFRESLLDMRRRLDLTFPTARSTFVWRWRSCSPWCS